MKGKAFGGFRAGFSFPLRNAAVAFALCVLFAAAPQMSASAAQNTEVPQDVDITQDTDISQDMDIPQDTDIPQNVELNGANVDGLESAVEPLIGEYDSETGFYKYTVGSGSELWCNALLYPGGVEVQSFWIGSDYDDITITITGGGDIADLDGAFVITEAGTYAVDISYSPENGDSASWRYAVTVSPDAESTVEPDVTGRLDTEPDGEERSYAFGTIGSVRTNVVDGETLSIPVKLLADKSLTCTITRDGSSYALPADGIIAEDGAYDVKLTAVYADGSIETRFLSFSIYTDATNRVGIYTPPRGCVITAVTLDGESYPFTATSCRFTADGAYSVSYTGENLNRTVTIIREATPPVLYFNGTNAAEFNEAVEITSDSECEIVIKRNGVMLSSANLIKSSGIYIVTATDSAGNEVTYRIVVTLKQFDSLLLCAAILGALAVAGAVYLAVTKKRGIKIR